MTDICNRWIKLKCIVAMLAITGGLMLLWQIALADPVSAFAPGTVTEQQNVIPSSDTPLPTIMEGLESEKTDTRKARCSGFLQRNNART